MLGVSRQAVGDLVRRKILSEDKEGKIDVKLARVALEQKVRPSSKTAQALAPETTAPANKNQDTEKSIEEVSITSYHVAKTLNEVAQARINQLKLKEMQGELIRVEAVKAALANMFSATRDALLQLPARLAPLLAAESDAATTKSMLHQAIHEALSQLSTASEKINSPNITQAEALS